MKKMMLVLTAVLISATATFAQSYVEFVPNAGYTFSDRVSGYNTYSKLGGTPNLGGSFLFNVNRVFGFELMYNYTGGTSGVYQYTGYGQSTTISQGNLGIHSIMLGPVQYFYIPGSSVRPFLGAMLGAAVFSPGVNGYSNDVNFAWGLQMGTNINFTPNFGLRLKASLLSPVPGNGFYAGNDAAGTPVIGDASSGIYQLSLNAGLIFGLGRPMPSLQPRRHYRPQPRYRPYYRPYPY